jgi:hypothetical protein
MTGQEVAARQTTLLLVLKTGLQSAQ